MALGGCGVGEEVRRELGGVAPRALAHLPTPLEHLPRIAPNLWVKRDDCTGLGMGGNKTRKLEYLVADAVARGCDTLITAGGVQSNHARQTAAAAAKTGLACHLVLNRNVPAMPEEYFATGNCMLDAVLGATLHIEGPGVDRTALMEDLCQELRQAGHAKPYVIPIGGSNVTGSLGYVNCAFELARQWDAGVAPRPAFLVTASSSYGTQAGLIAGLEILRRQYPGQFFPEVIGVNVDDEQVAPVESSVRELTRNVLVALGEEDTLLRPQSVRVEAGYSQAYGVPTEAMKSAVLEAARTEGLLLDPVYSGKAFAFALDFLKQVSDDQTVLFLHTGGAPGLFAYREFLTSA